MNKTITERWKGMFLDPEKPSPFGTTKEGYQDYRRAPVSKLKTWMDLDPVHRDPLPDMNLEGVEKLDGATFNRYDFSGARLDHLRISNCIFRDCLFDRATLTDLRDHGGSLFEDCSFQRVDLRSAYLGMRLSGITTGSTYRRCTFDGARTSRISFQHVVFAESALRGEDWRSVDFGVSGFFNCAFSGAVYNVIFRGDYFYDDDREKYGKPQKTGLHNVSFLEATLNSVDLRGGCEADTVTLPRDGSTFICRTADLLALESDTSLGLSDLEAAKLIHFYNIARANAKGQEERFVNKSDIIYFCEELSGIKIYELFKSRLTSRC